MNTPATTIEERVKEQKYLIIKVSGQGGKNQRQRQERGTGNDSAYYLYLDSTQLTKNLYDTAPSRFGVNKSNVSVCLIHYLNEQGFSFSYNGNKPLHDKVSQRYRDLNKRSHSHPVKVRSSATTSVLNLHHTDIVLSYSRPKRIIPVVNNQKLLPHGLLMKMLEKFIQKWRSFFTMLFGSTRTLRVSKITVKLHL